MSATSQWWPRSATLNTGAVRFIPLMDGINTGSGLSATENQVNSPIAAAGSLISIYIKLSAAPGTLGSGKSYRFQVSVNATPSATLDVTISETATTGNAVATVAIAKGDLVSVKETPTGTPNAANAQIWLEWEPTTASNYVYPCLYGGGQVKGTAGAYNRLLQGNNSDKTTESLANSTRDIVPFAATITDFYVDLSVAPGVGKSWDFAIMVNGVEDATSVLNIANTATNGHLNSLTIAISAGDMVTFELKTATGGPSNTRIKWSVCMVPTIAYQFHLGGAASTSRTSGTFVAEIGELNNENGTETNVQLTAPVAMFFQALYAVIGTAPGSGKSWTFTQRINTGNGSLSAVLNNTTTGNDTTHSDSIAANDLIDFQCVLGGSSPTGMNGYAVAVAASMTALPKLSITSTLVKVAANINTLQEQLITLSPVLVKVRSEINVSGPVAEDNDVWIETWPDTWDDVWIPTWE